ncbi:pyridoxamine 5'-phosphate oxidase [Nonomuraea sp. PA05]|uniref:pyridoxamine 5'-phosphate oxidase family protein n=1 Tax=Nonomuraea sp. PA05 TaxID=2604466 RepID=UPI0011D9C7BE|nr:pyridoxamine 5'-phosphate oxidase family protein [Nonomuraea sp. PA05]TYB50640.1 pyridoxamine 5'-phosphate oxidase [Nonomuraea sp. PA05]
MTGATVRLPRAARDFLAEPGVATLTTLRPDGTPHVVPVRFTWDRESGLARVLTVATSRKARNLTTTPATPAALPVPATPATPGGRAALCQVAGFRWLTLEGRATVSHDPHRIAEATTRYTHRYLSPPPAPPGRVVIEIAVDRFLHLNL